MSEAVKFIDKRREVSSPAPVQSEAGAIVAMIERAARDPNVDIDKMERLWAMKSEMDARNAEQAFNAAMSAAQAEMTAVLQDEENTQTRSRYASYAALDRVLRPIYTRHGFSVTFDTDEMPDQVIRVICEIAHAAGHTKQRSIPIPADGKGAKGGDVMTKTHATVSAVSYGRRTLLKMGFNVAETEHDDDGNAAGSERISQEQLDQLRDKIDEVGADIQAFCKLGNVGGLAEIQAKDFDDAMALLEKKARQS